MSNKVSREELPHYGKGVIERFVIEQRFENDYVKTVSNILHREGCNRKAALFSGTALDLDALEANRSNGNAECTVDMVVGCVKDWLLLVELKLRVAKVTTKVSTSIKEKKKYSRLKINVNESFPVCPSVVILLKDKNFEQNKNKLMRLLDNNLQYVPMTVKIFHNKVFA